MSVTPRRTLHLANVAIFAANVVFAVGNVVGTITLNGMNPILFALIREAVAGPLLCLVAYWSESPKLTKSDLPWFLLTGAMLYLNNLAYILGVKLAGATAAGVWQPAQPVFITVMALLFKYEEAALLKFCGIAIAGAGCLIIVLLSEETDSGKNMAAGHITLFSQAVACSAFYVSEKPLLLKYPPVTVLGYAYIIATLFMSATAAAMNNIDTVLNFVCDDCDGGWHVPEAAWFGIAYYVFAVSVLAYFLMCWGNQYVDPSLLGIYTVTQPVVTVMTASAVIAVSNPPHWGLKGLKLSDLGAIGVVIGLCIVVYDNKVRSDRKAKEVLLEKGVEERDKDFLSACQGFAPELSQDEEDGKEAQQNPITKDTDRESFTRRSFTQSFGSSNL